jgi:hypothetical protein
MGSDQHHTLMVTGLQCRPVEFANILQRTIYGTQPCDDALVEVTEGPHPKFEFRTQWDIPLEFFTAMSAKRTGQTFLLEHSSQECGFRGQVVIRDGVVLEQIYRGAYDYIGPYEITHPVVDIFQAHLGPRNLAQAASSRLEDAITIVKQLKEALEDECGNRGAKKTLERLTAMLDSMQAHTAQINFMHTALGESEVRAI